MNEELFWLAENVNQWDEKMDRVARQTYGSQWFDQASFPHWEGFTREQWQAARDELAGQQKEWMRPCPDCGGIDFEHNEECEAMTHNEEITLFSTPDEDEAWAEAEKRMDAIGQNGPTGEHYEKPLEERYPHYYKSVRHLEYVDVYQVHHLFGIEDWSGCIQHASKKLLLSGVRTGGKTKRQDVEEARDTLTRWLEVESGK